MNRSKPLVTKVTKATLSKRYVGQRTRLLGQTFEPFAIVRFLVLRYWASEYASVPSTKAESIVDASR